MLRRRKAPRNDGGRVSGLLRCGSPPTSRGKPPRNDREGVGVEFSRFEGGELGEELIVNFLRDGRVFEK